MRSRGFTLLEVMISLAILGLALTAIIDINGGAIRMHTYSKQVTVATMLARYEMGELEAKFKDEGFTSEFDQTMSGKFDEEGWEDFRWEAEIVVPNLDGKNASALVEQIVTKMMGSMGGGAGGAGGGDSAAPAGPTVDAAGGLMGSLMPMLEQQVTTLTTMLQKSVREVRLKVIWKGPSGQDESVDVTTHMVVLAPAGQPGGESTDPELTATTPQAGVVAGNTNALPPNLSNVGGMQPNNISTSVPPVRPLVPAGPAVGPGAVR